MRKKQNFQNLLQQVTELQTQYKSCHANQSGTLDSYNEFHMEMQYLICNMPSTQDLSEKSTLAIQDIDQTDQLYDVGYCLNFLRHNVDSFEKKVKQMGEESSKKSLRSAFESLKKFQEKIQIVNYQISWYKENFPQSEIYQLFEDAIFENIIPEK